MSIALTLKRLSRRWYILVPGFILAVSLAAGAWLMIPPKYERTATQVLLPGTSSLPDNANPYYYLGGLSQAADVLVRAVGSDNIRNDIQRDHPGVAVEVTRDPTTSGPVVYIAVTAGSDAEAATVLNLLVERTVTELDALQDVNDAAKSDRITVVPVSVDERSTLRQRDKFVGTIAAGGIIVVLTVLIAALIEGLASRNSTRSQGGDDNVVLSDSDRSARPAVGLRPLPSSAGARSPAQPVRALTPRRHITSPRPPRDRGVADVQ